MLQELQELPLEVVPHRADLRLGQRLRYIGLQHLEGSDDLVHELLASVAGDIGERAHARREIGTADVIRLKVLNHVLEDPPSLLLQLPTPKELERDGDVVQAEVVDGGGARGGKLLLLVAS